LVNAADPASLDKLTAQPGYVQAVVNAIAQVSRASSTAAAISLLKEASICLGADAATFTSFVQDDATLGSYRFLLACDPIWGVQYANNGWCRDDPWLRYAMYRTEPICADHLPPLNERERWVSEAAAHFGFISTLIVPAPSAAARSRVSVLCLGSRQADFFNCDACHIFRCLARGLAMELADWMHRQVRSELLAHARITADDLALLRHEQQGHSSKVIAAALNTEPKTIDCRFHRLSLKLGTPNRRAAVRLAEIYGLL
jgi:hypothetical protein